MRLTKTGGCFALLVAATLTQLACSDDAGDRKGVPFGDGGKTGSGAAGAGMVPPPPPPDEAAAGDCPGRPIAYVLDTTDPLTMSASTAPALLADAGFTVEALPLDRDPAALRGLIVLSSFASESADYRDYVSRNAAQLLQFAREGNVLLQLTQDDQREATPPFLPADRITRREDSNVGRLFVTSPRHPLLRDVPVSPDGALAWEDPHAGWQTFASQNGFEVLLAGTPGGAHIALMEASVGRGRMILAAMPIDKAVGPAAEREQFSAAFLRNLRGHVAALCARRPPALRVTPSAAQPGFAETSTMLAILPDTQIYSLNYPGIFTAQTSWIAANAQKRHIPYVLHLGDIVDQNTPMEWQRAAQAMSQLDGVVPYALVPGNHDYGASGTALTRDTLLNDYFAFDRRAAVPGFGGAFEPGKLDNTYHFFTVGGRDYILLALEWGPRDAVVAWADRIMTEHPDRYGILITHAYLFSDSRRYDFRDGTQYWNPHDYHTAGDVNDGEELWQKLVRKHRFVMVFNGHVLNDGTGYLASVTDEGNTCHQMLSNYQFRDLGGEGFMRLVEFLDDGVSVRVYTYSPLYDRFLTEPDQNFSFMLDLPPGPRP